MPQQKKTHVYFTAVECIYMSTFLNIFHLNSFFAFTKCADDFASHRNNIVKHQPNNNHQWQRRSRISHIYDLLNILCWNIIIHFFFFSSTLGCAFMQGAKWIGSSHFRSKKGEKKKKMECVAYRTRQMYCNSVIQSRDYLYPETDPFIFTRVKCEKFPQDGELNVINGIC